MYKSLVKSNWVVIHDEEMRVIDNNALAEKKMKARESRPQPDREEQALQSGEEDGFSEGIPSEHLEALLDADADSSVIKGGGSREERDALLAEIEKAKQELSELRSQADQMLQDARDEIEDRKAKAYEEAREQGYQDGRSEGLKEAEALEQEYRSREEQRQRDYQQQIEALEPRFIEELTDIYEHVFRVDLSGYQGLVSSLLSNAMRKIDAAGALMLHVSREDYEGVLADKEKLRMEMGGGNFTLEIIEDMTLSQSQCFIETENGIYDCSLDTQLKELTRKLRLLSYDKNS